METIEMLLNVRITIIHTARNPEILRHEDEIKTHSELSVPLFYHLKQCVIDSTDRRRRLNSKAMITLINQENTISHLIESIAEYLRRARNFILANESPLPMENPDLCLLNSQFSHRFHVTQRLDALGFFIIECADRNIYASVEDVSFFQAFLLVIN
uniref:Uncharacterized protein n=1 Tax=Panagrolaimus superbus TaxID=310955 RepID=A0A914YSK6_9BILA